MILGIGVDSVKISRIAQSIQRKGFSKRAFSEEEQALWQGCSEARTAEIAAACFAAKEAFLKAAGRGLGGFALPDIGALRRASGAPFFRLSGTAAQWVEENGVAAHLSITHDAGIATAFVVMETQAKTGIAYL